MCMMLCEGLEGEVGDFPLFKRSKSPFGRLGTAGEVAVGADAVVLHQFTLLPNPAKEIAYLFYRMPWEETAVYSLYNTLGELVATQPIDGSLQLVEIPTSKMAAGIYFVNVQQADKMLYSAKLSVTK